MPILDRMATLTPTVVMRSTRSMRNASGMDILGPEVVVGLAEMSCQSKYYPPGN